MNKKTLIKITAVALVAAVIILIILSSFQEPVLVLEDNETGKIYMKIPVSDGEEFSVTFVHSVNKSPCSDIYQIRDGDIYLTKTTLYGFGAGVPTELYGDQVMTRGEDGEMIISNIHNEIDIFKGVTKEDIDNRTNRFLGYAMAVVELEKNKE